MLNFEDCLHNGEGIVIHNMQEYEDFARECSLLGYRNRDAFGVYSEKWGSVYFTLGSGQWLYFDPLKNRIGDRHLVEWASFRSKFPFIY